MTDRLCPICSEALMNVVTVPSLSKPWCWCPDCEIHFEAEEVAPEDDLKYYTSGEFHDAHRPAPLSAAVSEGKRAQRVVMELDKAGVWPRRLLDIGSGMGILAWTAKTAFGCEIMGVEPYEGYANANPNVPHVSTLAEVTDTFDTITCIHTLEHIPNLIATLERIYSLLTPAGAFLLETPTFDVEDPWTVGNAFAREHHYVFTENGLRKLLSKVGFEVKSVIYSGWPHYIGRRVNLMIQAQRVENEKRKEDQTSP